MQKQGMCRKLDITCLLFSKGIFMLIFNAANPCHAGIHKIWIPAFVLFIDCPTFVEDIRCQHSIPNQWSLLKRQILFFVYKPILLRVSSNTFIITHINATPPLAIFLSATLILFSCALECCCSRTALTKPCWWRQVLLSKRPEERQLLKPLLAGKRCHLAAFVSDPLCICLCISILTKPCWWRQVLPLLAGKRCRLAAFVSDPRNISVCTLCTVGISVVVLELWRWKARTDYYILFPQLLACSSLVTHTFSFVTSPFLANRKNPI